MSIFLDCGYYAGVILDQFLERGEIDSSWDVIVFEPNRELDVSKSLQRFPFEAQWVDKAVWVHDDGVDFWISEFDNASYVEDAANNAPRNKIQVPSIDFSEYVRSLPNTKIICSMDIEGSEFPVLEKMIEEDTINKIDILDIEFHNRVANQPLSRTYEIYNEIEKRGVEIRLKIPVEGIDGKPSYPGAF